MSNKYLINTLIEDDLFMETANHLTGLGLGFLSKILDAKSPTEELHLLKTAAWFSAMTAPRIQGTQQNLGWPHLEDRISWFPPIPADVPFRGDKSGPNVGITWIRTYVHGLRTFHGVGSTDGWSGWLLSWSYALWDYKRLDGWGILRSDSPDFTQMIIDYGKMRRDARI